MDTATFVGVDGGGTSTKFVCIDSFGRTLSQVESGATNWNSVSKPVARSNLLSGLQSLLSNASISPVNVRRMCLSMSGVHTSEDVSTYLSWVSPMFPNTGVLVCNDVWAALASGTEGDVTGVVCIAGTGMNCFGRCPTTGTEWHAGGMGPLLGDVGSGYYIGSELLVACARANDGRDSDPSAVELLEALKSRFGWSKFEELLHWRYEVWKWDEVALLAEMCFQMAEKGNRTAQNIVDQGAHGLAKAICTVVKKLWGQEGKVDVVLAGSIWKSQAYRETVEQILKSSLPSFELRMILPSVSACMGAAMIAMKRTELQPVAIVGANETNETKGKLGKHGIWMVSGVLVVTAAVISAIKFRVKKPH